MIEQAIVDYLTDAWVEDAESTLSEMETLVESWNPENWDVFTKPTEVQLLEVHGF